MHVCMHVCIVCGMWICMWMCGTCMLYMHGILLPEQIELLY